MTGEEGELPEGWGWATVGEVCERVEKVDPRRDPGLRFEYIDIGGVDGGSGRIVETKSLLGEEAPSRARQLVRAGDTVLSTVRTYQRKTATVAEHLDGAVASTGFAVLRSRPGISARFLFHQVRSSDFVDALNEQQTGTSYPAVRERDVRAMPIRLAPQLEQEQIATAIEEHLSRLDAAEEGVRSSVARLRVFWTQTLAASFSEFEASRPVGGLAEVRGGIQKQPKRKPVKNTAPFLRVANVLRGRLDLEEVHRIELFDGELDRYRLEEGDLLVVEGNGSPEQIGRAARWADEVPGSVHQNHLIRVRPGPDLDPDFLDLYWNAPTTASVLREVASSTSGLYTLSTRKVKDVPVPVASVERQRAVAAELRNAQAMVARLETELTAELARGQALRRSILAAAFSGRLVAQHPAEGSADVLWHGWPRSDPRQASEQGQGQVVDRSEGELVVSGDPKAMAQKLWDFCDVLRDDGLSYGDYIEQLTFLLFLKMADEQHALLGEERVVPEGLDWPSLLKLSGPDLERHYNEILTRLGGGEDMLAVVFRKARNKIQSPAKLEQLIRDFIDEHEWLSLDADLKGDAYEALIEKTAREGARGAGQYFTPRAVISAMVEVMAPKPSDRICDPACGTGGFFLGAYQSIVERFSPLDPDQREHLRSGAFTGWEIAELPARLCAMNMLLHGIESPDSDSPVHVDDALRDDPGVRFDMVLSNPPFGRSSSDSYERETFWTTTRNKQLNFVQHIVGLLKVGGTAAVVVPDNVLFEAGAGETIRRRLLHDCDVHTILRLPTGIFYAQGVKANVIFFERREGAEHPWTRDVWVYDLRTNQHFTLKQNPIRRADLDDFVACYRPGQRHLRVESERFKKFTYDELIERDKVSLDVFWLRNESLEDTDNLPAPGVIAAEIVEDLEAALEEFRALADSLQSVGITETGAQVGPGRSHDA